MSHKYGTFSDFDDSRIFGSSRVGVVECNVNVGPPGIRNVVQG